MKFLRCVSSNARPGRGILPFLGALLIALAAPACESLYDELSDCYSGVKLRFVYEYHMEQGANAFPSNVDCIDVYVFDAAGGFVTQFSETSSVLKDESYRMDIPLQPGSYRLVVYGGLSCDRSEFRLSPQWDGPSADAPVMSDITVTLPLDEDGVSRRKLHDIEERSGGLFYGTLDLTLTEDDISSSGYREETVRLMKDTNNIQVILQELEDPYVIDVADYEFKIVDDNFVLDADNKFIEIANEDFRPCYRPYFTENRQMGYVNYVPEDGARVEEDASRPVQVACAEFSTSRLFMEHLSTARLVVSDSRTGAEIINIPLILYLTAIRGHGDTWIKSDQEFLDRQSRWDLILFLRNGKWNSTSIMISVNAWIVRINNMEF